MLLFVILSPMSGSPVVQLKHQKNCTAVLKEKMLDPYILSQMAKSLYIIGTELKSGGLKELDLTYYSLITHLDDDYLLILGVDNNSKRKKKFPLLRAAMGGLHAEFIKIAKQPTPETISVEEVIRILSGANLKKESKNLIPF
ncbi:MAG: hypothetical protein ACTSYI_03630 [Promethearchaeota archaeon]